MENKTNKFSHLNKEQLQAVKHASGPLLVVAGAGTGKTTVLINRLLYLVMEKKYSPDEILLTTFTEKAAQEMEQRALEILPYGYFDLWINTFHSFCERILKDHGLEIGLPGDFQLLDQTQQWILIYNNLDKFKLDYYKPLGNPTKFISELIKHFSRLKDEVIWSQDYLKYSEDLEKNSDQLLAGFEDVEKEQEIIKVKELANAYHLYNQLLLENSYLDFGDLIIYTLKLLQSRPKILKYYQNKFKQVMVDEFQDTNWAQYELIKLLSAKDSNLIVVGDDDQSIYRFRGSSIFNIMKFKDDYPKAKEIVLTSNYRSGQEILDRAYSLITNNNPNRLEEKINIDKKLKSQTGFSGQVEHWHLEDEDSELSFVREKIQAIKTKNPDSLWFDFAILVRANDAADKFVKELNRQGIPNMFVSLKGLYYKPLILDAISYFKLLDNYHKSSALYRVLNFDYFSLPYNDIVSLNKVARNKTWSLFEALEKIEAVKNIKAESVKKVKKLLSLIDKHSKMAKDKLPSQVFLSYVKDFSIADKLDKDRDKDKFSHLNQFYRKIKEMENVNENLTVKDFVDLLNLEIEAGESGKLSLEYDDSEVVKIMTIHAAKGLEFKYVFVSNLVDKRFPTINRTDKISMPEPLVKEKIDSDKDFHLEEERRLFYVAVTRAKEELYLTSAKNYGGKTEKKVSPFVEELGLSKKQKFSASSKALSELEKDLAEEKVKEEIKIGKYKLPEKFSFSQLESYSNCPWQYRFAFILKVPVPEKASLSFGRSMHNTLYEFLYPVLDNDFKQANLFAKDAKSNNSKEVLNEKRLMDLYQKNWQEGGYRDKQEKAEYYQKGQESLKNFLKNIEEEGIPTPIMLEKSFVYKLGQYPIKGTIDRVDKLADGTVEVIDYKTGKVKDKLDKKNKRQLMIYQLALENTLGLKVSKLSYYFLDKEGKKVSFVAKEKDLEKLESELLEEIKEIVSMNFIPKPDVRTCGFCDFNGICEFRKV
ncbi:MAG: ATP-dependent helicase [Candidatus Pacebacteria bacterium]|nr:ATP-dependent helicase [Candidatus Paceibacterota bacterium]